jgi:hypothetical protein
MWSTGKCHKSTGKCHKSTQAQAARARAFVPTVDVEQRFPFVNGVLDVPFLFLFTLLCAVFLVPVALVVMAHSL